MARWGCSLSFARLFQSANSMLFARQERNLEHISSAVKITSGIGTADETGFRNDRTAVSEGFDRNRLD
jgi:hypothetical protein